MPLILGLVLGAVPADRVSRRVGPKVTVAVGFAVLAAALLIGARTTVDSSAWFVAAWMAGVGMGMGIALSTAAAGALAELPEERSGVGAAVMQACQKLGGPFGAAILGSALASVYRAQVSVGALPAPAMAAVRGSVFSGLAVAQRLHSPELLASVRAAFVDGMDVALLVSAGFAAAGLVCALIFLPGRVAVPAAAEERVVAGI